MKVIAKFILFQSKLLMTLKFKQYLRYTFSIWRKETKIEIFDTQILIRKNSSDLTVAMETLGGEFEVLRYLFDADYDGLIIDAGGYIGTAAIAISKIYPKAKILSIEPSPENFRILQKNIEKYSNISALNYALTDGSTKEIELHSRPTGHWGYTIMHLPKETNIHDGNVTVRCISLSDLVDNYTDVGILKLDIEGAELHLMLHTSEPLQKIPVVLAELHDHIIPGCTEQYFKTFSRHHIIKGTAEKYLSIKTTHRSVNDH